METVWNKPPNCDIIPLAKLQLLKENTEGPSKDRYVERDHSAIRNNNDASTSRGYARGNFGFLILPLATIKIQVKCLLFKISTTLTENNLY